MNIFGKGRRVWLAGAAVALSGAAVFTYFTEFSPEERTEGVRVSGASDAQYAAAQPGFTLDVRRGDTLTATARHSDSIPASAMPAVWSGESVEVLGTVRPVGDAVLPGRALPGSGVTGVVNAAALRAPGITLRVDDGRVLKGTRQREQLDRSGATTWVGSVDGVYGSMLVMTEYRGVVTGFATVGTDTYEITTGRDGRQLVYRVDERRLPKSDEVLYPEGAEADTTGTSTTGDLSAGAIGGVVQDLMVVYTPASRAAYGQAGVESMIINAVAAANQSYQNSGVAITLNLVYLGETAYDESGTTISQSLSSLQGTTDGKMDEVHTLRKQYGADMVSLVSQNGDACGVAWAMRSVSTSFASSAFSVVNSGCLSNHSLAHEIGHNQGNMHDRASTSNTGAYPYSYGYRRCVTDGSGFRDVMSYPCDGAPRVTQFSNPNVLYNGYATGIDYAADPANSADNARSMNGTASTVAAFVGSTSTSSGGAPSSPGSLTASAASSQLVNLSWADNSADETGFKVERSANGVDWAEIATVGSGQVSYSDNGVAAVSTYYYRVRAYNGVGNSAYSNQANVTTPDVPPTAPAGVAAMDNANGSATVTWADLSSNETCFQLRRQTWDSRKLKWGSAVLVASVGAGSTSFLDNAGAGSYQYTVQAVNDGGSSPAAGPAPVSVTGGKAKGRR